MDIEKLVFIDETWTSTNMTRRYGRAPKGQRCVASAPLGNWQTTTFVAGLRRHRLTAPLVADGPMDGEMFLAWVQQCLCPTLEPGDIAILDNLSSHKVAGIQEAIARAGATAPQSRQTKCRRPIERDRRTSRYPFPKRMRKLLLFFRICMHLNENRSSLRSLAGSGFPTLVLRVCPAPFALKLNHPALPGAAVEVKKTGLNSIP